MNRVDGVPRGLYALARDPDKLAAAVSCGQHIAGDGAFCLGTIADYMDSLTTYGDFEEAQEASVRASQV